MTGHIDSPQTMFDLSSWGDVRSQKNPGKQKKTGGTLVRLLSRAAAASPGLKPLPLPCAPMSIARLVPPSSIFLTDTEILLDVMQLEFRP